MTADKSELDKSVEIFVSLFPNDTKWHHYDLWLKREGEVVTVMDIVIKDMEKNE